MHDIGRKWHVSNKDKERGYDRGVLFSLKIVNSGRNNGEISFLLSVKKKSVIASLQIL